jgi:hypothetical protein
MPDPLNKPARPSGVVRALFTLISAVCVGLGTLAILTEVHTGSTRRQGMVTLEGEAAVAMGVMMVVLGLLPLAIWARTPTQAKWWIGLCMAAFAVLLVRMLMGPGQR